MTLMATLFRTAVTIQPVMLLIQSALAGFALAGSAAALRAHAVAGGAILLASALQAATSFPLWRSARISGRAATGSLGLLAAIIVQMVAGRFGLFALHLPLGMLLFGASTGFLVSWRSYRGWRRSARSWRSRSVPS